MIFHIYNQETLHIHDQETKDHHTSTMSLCHSPRAATNGKSNYMDCLSNFKLKIVLRCCMQIRLHVLIIYFSIGCRNHPFFIIWKSRTKFYFNVILVMEDPFGSYENMHTYACSYWDSWSGIWGPVILQTNSLQHESIVLSMSCKGSTLLTRLQ